LNSLVFDCELVSPLFLYGADQKNPELRAPSLKGNLRFWWRAVQAEKNISLLKAQEGKIFGGTGSKVDTGHNAGKTSQGQEGRSSFTIKIASEKINKQQESQLPHKPTNFKPTAIVNTLFKIECLYVRLPEEFSDIKLKALVELTSLLGGMGKRSRRGFGSFRILRCNGQKSELAELKQEDVLPQILKRLNILSDNKFALNKGVITLINNPSASYPYIETIALGKAYQNVDEILRKIGNSSHENNSKYTGYSAGKDRFASPEYVSLIKGGQGEVWPVITSLHLALKTGINFSHEKDTRKAFREAILS